MSIDATLLPVEGTWVRRAGSAQEIGCVLQLLAGEGEPRLRVQWRDAVTTERLSSLASGIEPGFTVQDVPSSVARRTLGIGRVRAVRRLAGVDQSLVQLEADGRSLWLPGFALRRLMGPDLAFLRAQAAHPDAGERFALCLAGHALRLWNEATGALDRLDIDPLPHQLSLVHRIVSSGETSWIIADDVGLGKTIEVGLLLAALERSRAIRRILVICPAGLTRQWQDEMKVKFDRPFSIYGDDFQADAPWKWRLHDQVIASLDLVKPRDREDDGADGSTHFGRLLTAGRWDIVIFDEGHRLSRTDAGTQTLRYLLGRAMRERTAGLVLLTGTPHQGDTGKFRSLLTLVRPDLKDAIDQLDIDPSVVGEIVLRNRKMDVTDAAGEFIFQGHSVTQVPVDPSPAMHELDRRLRAYLRRGYNAGARMGGAGGRAIGFVMTTYRKLASSSVAAIERALRRRLDRLDAPPAARGPRPQGWGDEDSADDLGELDLGEPAGEFFADEAAMLRHVIAQCAAAAAADAKIAAFRAIYDQVVRQGGRKMLVFSEYRATQDRLMAEVRALSGADGAQINGGQKLGEKLEAIGRFERDVPVLVSTEAGGEGLNLQRHCHIVLNYDLPWNPARLVQRIGRVYRYGQTHHVRVLNLLSRDTIDADILSTALTRVDAMAREMATTSGEFRDGYQSEVLGQLLDQLDLAALLDEARSGPVLRSPERIDEAIKRAREAVELQDAMLRSAGQFDPAALARLGRFRTLDVLHYIARMAPFAGFDVTIGDLTRERLQLRLGDALRGRFPEYGARTVIEATTSRATAATSPSVTLLDFGGTFLAHLVARSGAPEFGGGYAAYVAPDRPGQLAAFLTRWQSEQGDPLGEELRVWRRTPAGEVVADDGAVLALLDAPVTTVAAPRPNDVDDRSAGLAALGGAAERDAAAQVTRQRIPNDMVLLAAADAIG